MKSHRLPPTGGGSPGPDKRPGDLWDINTRSPPGLRRGPIQRRQAHGCAPSWRISPGSSRRRRCSGQSGPPPSSDALRRLGYYDELRFVLTAFTDDPDRDLVERARAPPARSPASVAGADDGLVSRLTHVGAETWRSGHRPRASSTTSRLVYVDPHFLPDRGRLRAQRRRLRRCAGQVRSPASMVTVAPVGDAEAPRRFDRRRRHQRSGVVEPVPHPCVQAQK